ncbi:MULTISPECIES: hypothetical protein [unclassified Clostridium]|uniref:hypothetical protein n=1 Tax=unclassified Clostridium TaxID=2614128 RepID=UPI0025C63CAB|nr:MULTISPECIES: hypothetical protein [unclassified Clostridium]
MSRNSKSCNYCCGHSECNDCFERTFDVVGFEIQCTKGSCSECPCYGCGEDEE